jgi:hypothetical protein
VSGIKCERGDQLIETAQESVREERAVERGILEFSLFAHAREKRAAKKMRETETRTK